MNNRLAFNVPFSGLFYLLIMLNLLASCNLPPALDGKGLLVVSLPGSQSGEARAIKLPKDYLERNIEDMYYVIDFTGPGKVQSVTVQPGQTFTIQLEPGRWRIKVTAWGNFRHPGNNNAEITRIGAGSVEVDVAAGRENRIAIPISVLDEFLFPKSQGYSGRWWTSELDNENNRFYIWADEIEFIRIAPLDDEPLYQWYDSNGIKLDTQNDIDNGSRSKNFFPEELQKPLPDTLYYYCDITYMFESNLPGGKEPRTIRSPIIIDPLTSKGLQNRIDAANPEWPISLPYRGGIVMNDPVVVNKTVTLNGSSTTLERDAGSAFGNSMFIVEDGGKLTLTGWELTLNGLLAGTGSSSAAPLVQVKKGGILVMGENSEWDPSYINVVLQGNRVSGNGGAVYLDNGGSFIMYSGKITNNDATESGGGIYVDAGGTFTMYGGIIGDEASSTSPQGNISANGGGVYVSAGGTFRLNGGDVSHNTAHDMTDGNGGGVYVAGSFTMTGGSINKNKASTAASPGTGEGGNGGGVFIDVSGSFYIYSPASKISVNGNTAITAGSQVYNANVGMGFYVDNNPALEY
jgi:hypothetical protein